ncbi:hypothetical protein [Nocardiopsis sp. NPDC006938]|uniref:hypothetical protein n=1 Tax=Nocardiopsis sp. NPDC006938 TaxID=3364337 RepID=UPI0036936A57
MISRIASDMARHLPDGWRTGRLVVTLIGMYGIMTTEFENEAGEHGRVNLPGRLFPRIMDLRSGAYREGQGTWFTWRLEIRSEGEFASFFDYESQPPFTFAPGAEDYVDEANLYPRSDEFTPDWLREGLEEARRQLG